MVMADVAAEVKVRVEVEVEVQLQIVIQLHQMREFHSSQQYPIFGQRQDQGQHMQERECHGIRIYDWGSQIFRESTAGDRGGRWGAWVLKKLGKLLTANKRGANKADNMINRQLLLTYLYLLVYILLSSGVILYNKVVSPVKMTFEIYATCVIPISAFFASSLWYLNTFDWSYNHQGVDPITSRHKPCSATICSPHSAHSMSRYSSLRPSAHLATTVQQLPTWAPCTSSHLTSTTRWSWDGMTLYSLLRLGVGLGTPLGFGNTAYLFISVAFIQMLKALMPVATFLMAVICGTDKLRCDVFLNMVLVSVGVVISSYGEIHFNVVGTVYQVTGIFAEALRLVLTQVLLQKKGLTLNPVTSLYYIAPCRTGAVTIRVAGVLKDWILIALSTIIFPESTITRLNVIGYAIALCGVVMYNYLKVKDVRASQLPVESIPERAVKVILDLRMEKKSSDLYVPDSSNNSSNGGKNGWNSSASDITVEEEAPLIPPLRVSHLGRSQLGSHSE
ncbi:hypothetical protein TEA_005902 [Camellia sinensis var. sinensis]|uniref:Sugar phosphate transporter domain-containing protein n=1 Tax=Camellia sinensis var. sinensis TaxID=542762 RepID=A0A4S4E861_CAMSN|nr:hypothetical protein TEA_005902 [Camellia sinensis var. sinensis]